MAALLPPANILNHSARSATPPAPPANVDPVVCGTSVLCTLGFAVSRVAIIAVLPQPANFVREIYSFFVTWWGFGLISIDENLRDLSDLVSYDPSQIG